MEHQFILHPKLVETSIELAQLPLSTLLLVNDSQFPWFILVPRINEISEIYQLDWQQQQQLLNESSFLAELLMEVFNGDKLNVAALGNLCPQLHLHHVVRFTSDMSWPEPIWGKHPAIAYSQIEIEAIKDKLVPALIRL
jgi:diadenosine tetraphosphate (Ap4A) HIT family hydrolase